MFLSKYPEAERNSEKIIEGIFRKFKIVVATCGTASNSRHILSRKFTRVLIDEATMVKEIDSLLPTKNVK